MEGGGGRRKGGETESQLDLLPSRHPPSSLPCDFVPGVCFSDLRPAICGGMYSFAKPQQRLPVPGKLQRNGTFSSEINKKRLFPVWRGRRDHTFSESLVSSDTATRCLICLTVSYQTEGGDIVPDTQRVSLAPKGNIFGMNVTLIPVDPHKSPRRRALGTKKLGNSLVVRTLGFRFRGLVSISGWGTKAEETYLPSGSKTPSKSQSGCDQSRIQCLLFRPENLPSCHYPRPRENITSIEHTMWGLQELEQSSWKEQLNYMTSINWIESIR